MLAPDPQDKKAVAAFRESPDAWGHPGTPKGKSDKALTSENASLRAEIAVLKRAKK